MDQETVIFVRRWFSGPRAGSGVVRSFAVMSSILAFAVALLSGTHAAVASRHEFTPQQSDAIRQIVRDYLIKNPEVILEAIEALKAKDQASTEARSRQTIAARRAEIFEDPESPIAGNAQGDVSIVEFFDYRCPYCKKVHSTIQALLRDDKMIRFIYKDWPILGPPSVYASRAALAARSQQKYVEFHAALMETRGSLDEAAVMSAAKSVGLDVDRLKRDMEAQAAKLKGIFARNDELARELGISGTPAFVVGDVVIRGAADLESLKGVVAEFRRRGPRSTRPAPAVQ